MSVESYFMRGKQALCPDCGQPTIFRAGCVMGDIIERSPTIPPRVVDRLVNNLLDTDICFSCDKQLNVNRQSQALWINLVAEEIAGPFCHECFAAEVQVGLGGLSEMNEDVKVYSVILNNKRTLQALEAVKSSPRRKAFEREMATPLARETIDPRRLF